MKSFPTPCDSITGRAQMEAEGGWQQLTLFDNLAWLRFPPGVEVAIIPPVTMAAARFRIRKIGDVDAGVSVYLDSTDSLGSVGSVYWELYPNKEGDTERYLLEETEQLMAALSRALGLD